MADGLETTILRRMAGMVASGSDPDPLTSSRAVRLVLAKVAQDCAGLPLAVSSVAEDIDDLDGMLAGLSNDLMLVGVHRDSDLVGLLGVDMELRAAVLEIATTGALLAQPAETRNPTGTDRLLCDPLLKGFLEGFPQAVRGTAYDHWADGVTAGDRLPDTRVAGLTLHDDRYRTVQMTVQLGQTDRQGMLLLALPLPRKPTEDVVPAAAPRHDWADAFRAVVESAPATLDAQLHRFTLPLSALQELRVGTVLPLDGCSVASVRLRGGDGRVVARARLGQSGGMRAIRIEAPPAPDLHELGTGAPLGGTPPPLPEIPEPEPGPDALPDTPDPHIADVGLGQP